MGITSTFSVSTKLGFLTASGLQTIGLNVSSDGTVALFRLVGIALAAIICTVLLLRSPRIGMARALGISMIVVVLLSPVVWPWYLAAGFALIAYASSYMKCHHPAVFTCALLNSQPMGFYAPAQLVRDEIPDLWFATHDGELANAARAIGFKVLGANPARAVRRPRLGCGLRSLRLPRSRNRART